MWLSRWADTASYCRRAPLRRGPSSYPGAQPSKTRARRNEPGPLNARGGAPRTGSIQARPRRDYGFVPQRRRRRRCEGSAEKAYRRTCARCTRNLRRQAVSFSCAVTRNLVDYLRVFSLLFYLDPCSRNLRRAFSTQSATLFTSSPTAIFYPWTFAQRFDDSWRELSVRNIW